MMKVSMFLRTVIDPISTYHGTIRRSISTATYQNILHAQNLSNKDVGGKKKKQILADLKTSPDTGFSELPILIVKATFNNTLCYLTDHKGMAATWTSAGIEGFKNAKRGTNYAGKVAGEAIAKRAVSLGVSKIRLKVKGMGPGKLEAVKGVIAGGLDIVSVTDITPTPHNGPKPKKARRL